MKTKLSSYLAVGTIGLFALTNRALAQSSGSDLQPKTLARALLASIIFSAVGVAAVFVAVTVFDKATPKIDIQKELLGNNVAVAIVTGAVVLGISLIVAASIMG